MKLIGEAKNEKLRGSFYTPPIICNFILKWAMNGNNKMDILEPSAGDGAFLRAIESNKYSYNSVTAIEIEETEAKKAALTPLKQFRVLNMDFHDYFNETEDRYDLVVGNPPFIRYQYFDNSQQDAAEKIFEKAKLKYSRLSNPWVSFVVGSSLLLKEKGKIGFVLPAEILQVSYAAEIRNFLAHFFNKIVLVSFRRLVFPSVQQDVVLLLCEKCDIGDHLIEHIELENSSDLETAAIEYFKKPSKKIDFASNKWTFYFLDQSEINFIEGLVKSEHISKLGKFAKVEVGMTTGANKYFTVPKEIVDKYDLSEYSYPMVGRSVQLQSVIFTANDWKKNVESGARSFMLLFPTMWEVSKNWRAMDYINLGIKEHINDKYYKTSIRAEWQIIPSAKISQLLFQRRNNIFPKFVLNSANAYTTDTMHRVNVKNGINPEALVASYYNSLSLATGEISGRSYGGGALELMPNETENILIPYREDNAEILGDIDKMFRQGKSIEEILSFTDPIILSEGYGFSSKEIMSANRIWKKLLQRRLARGNRINLSP